jgi:methyltransferase FkbM-like protein
MVPAALKNLLPDRPVATRIWCGPFRGACVLMNPRHSLRKAFGLYEHELNRWLEDALSRIETVIDIGANDGYFTFGCAAAFQRLKKQGKIFAFEPYEKAYTQLLATERRRQLNKGFLTNINISIVHRSVGSAESAQSTTLDTLIRGSVIKPQRALIKIDVEGAECDVIDGASCWLNESNLFLIEVHTEMDVSSIQARFAREGLELDCIHQRPLRLLGHEHRQKGNCWLVSRLTRSRLCS